jgi:hypothetical protein
MGEIGKLELSYDRDVGGAPREMIAKFATTDPELREMVRPARLFEREHRFYEILADKTPLRTPATYHITCNPSDDSDVSEEYLLLMEDLGHLTIGDQVAGVTPEHAATALRGLARHHAHFWNRAGLEGVSFAPDINGPLNQPGRSIYEASFGEFMDAFGGTLDATMVRVAAAWPHSYPAILDRLFEMPTTLVHCDFRADNLFFDDSDSENGFVAVIDWQGISQGGAASDVGYFLSQSLSIEDRRAHEEDLLRGYHDGLTSGGVSGYSFEQLRDDYRVGIIYGWIIPVLAVGSLDFTSERAVRLWTNVIERAQDAILHHNAQQFIS